jgi:hypothetical protein
VPVNPFLMQEVKRAMAAKRAFVATGAGAGAPPAGDPAAAGGAPPMDPAAMGGAPPMDPAAMGGAPPMDPAMMGGAPPMDPAMMGAPPMDPAAMGGAPAPTSGPSADEIRQLIKEEIQAAVSGGAAPGGEKPKSKGAAKVDPGQILEYMERVQKLIVNLYESLGLNLPYNILDKPAPEGEEAAPAQEPAKEQSSDATAGGISPIKPIEPMGGSKQAAVRTQAEALRYMLQAMSKGR